MTDEEFKLTVVGALLDQHEQMPTKRELFAAMAMQGHLADGADIHTAAKWAVESADALIAELIK